MFGSSMVPIGQTPCLRLCGLFSLAISRHHGSRLGDTIQRVAQACAGGCDADRLSRLVILLLAGAAPHAMAVNKCTTTSGEVVYQDAPCSNSMADAQRLRIQAAATAQVPQRPAPAAVTAPPASAAQPPAPMPAAIAPPPTSPLEARADACLNWYRPLLRDPRSAYWRDAYYVQDTLNITIVASNAFGGFVNKAAACDFREGRVDDGWTKTQASRRGW